MPATVSRRGHAVLMTVPRPVIGLAVLLLALSTASPSLAQKLYSYEPSVIEPYATVYVNDGSCSAGKVLRIQGTHRNLRRKKSCVPVTDLRSLPRH